ncbi:MAG: acetylglutamate kinase [Pedobacter sp.]|nr:MAG: acetylglutamate kinase [Pedobacter sp.]
MEKPTLKIVKIGGHVIDDSADLQTFLSDFAKLDGAKILVHGGGKLASEIGLKLGIQPQLHEGRRITDAPTLDLVTMVYAGLINKNIVAKLQALNINAIGVTGADANLIKASKRPVKTIDYGFVGDLEAAYVSGIGFQQLVSQGLTPICAPITHDGNGQLLNTNADTIASAIAVALSPYFKTELLYCFEKQGVLIDVNDPASLIREIHPESYANYKAKGIVAGGMIPKLDNAFLAIQQGVSAVYIGNSAALSLLPKGLFGTKIRA